MTEPAGLIGFDGSQVNGQLEIGAHVSEAFTHRQTPRYAGIVREVRLLASDASVLRANAGLIPPGKDDIDPALNAVKSLVAVKKGGGWEIALFKTFRVIPHAAAAVKSTDRRIARGCPTERTGGRQVLKKHRISRRHW